MKGRGRNGEWATRRTGETATRRKGEWANGRTGETLARTRAPSYLRDPGAFSPGLRRAQSSRQNLSSASRLKPPFAVSPFRPFAVSPKTRAASSCTPVRPHALFSGYFQPRTLKTTNNPAENVAAPSNTQTGSVRSQARAILRRVANCRPDPLAAIVPAIPEDKT